MENKYEYIEIQCILHTQCNLACKFCFETKEKGIREYKDINLEYIKNLPNTIIESIDNVVKENDIKTMVISLMGGEMYSDNISDEVFGLYEELIDKLNKYLLPLNIRYEFSTNSNGVFTKYERVERLLKKFNIKLVLSYDACDRFTTDAQKQMWYNTYQYFKERGYTSVSTVLTKRNINAYIAGDEIFNRIDTSTFIENDDYCPRLDYQEYLPSDEDYYNFFKWCIDNEKFNVITLCDIFKHSHRICNKKSISYFFSEEVKEKYNVPYITKCTEESPMCNDDYYGNDISCHIPNHDCLKYKQPIGLQKRGCLYCEHHGSCPTMCWDLILFKDYQITGCPIARIYQYIENNPDVVNKCKEWVDRYEKL